MQMLFVCIESIFNAHAEVWSCALLFGFYPSFGRQIYKQFITVE